MGPQRSRGLDVGKTCAVVNCGADANIALDKVIENVGIEEGRGIDLDVAGDDAFARLFMGPIEELQRR
jgi:hypothetical protein